jgi:hypothetical protein
MASSRTRTATTLDHRGNAASGTAALSSSPGRDKALPRPHAAAAVELLERPRAELSIVAPVLYVRLLTPENDLPALHPVRETKDDRVEIDPDGDGRYRWRSVGEVIGQPGQTRTTAPAVAAATGTPVRTRR